MNRYGIMGITLALLLPVLPTVIFATDNGPKAPFIKNDAMPKIEDYFAEMKSQNMARLSAQQESDAPPSFDISGRADRLGEDASRKNPTKAFLLSTILPGTGQFYNGSKIKAAVFFALEAASWAGYITFHGRGNDKTDEFEEFADDHWIQADYEQFLFDNWDVRDDDSVFDDNNDLLFTHHLPDDRTQQYYEMIGKYDQFVFGWDDADTNMARTYENLSITNSENRLHYESMRHDANKLYDKATASLIVIMANHVISGIEAAWAAKRHNRHLPIHSRKFSVRAVTANVDKEYFPMLTMTFKF